MTNVNGPDAYGAWLRALRLIGHQDWLRYGIRDRIIRRFWHLDRLPNPYFEVDFYGLRYQGDFRSYIDWVVYFYGAYEKPELHLLRELAQARPGTVFLDIGANLGQHSLFMSRFCERIHAFEPYAAVRRRFEANLRHNDIRNVTVHDVGLGQADLDLDFFAPTGENTGTGSFVATHATDNNVAAGKLRVVHADRYLAALGLARVDLIKIDVEGMEKQVLLGLRETLHTHRPTVLMEFLEDTRRSFHDEAEFRGLFPPDYRVRLARSEVPCGGVFNLSRCQYEDFDFDRSLGNLLLEPTAGDTSRSIPPDRAAP